MTSLAAFAPPADAQMTLTIGGFSNFQAGLFDTNVPNSTSRAFRNDTEVHVKADAKADNGLSYGLQLQIGPTPRNASSSLRYDEANIYLSGSWGKVELGDTDGAMSKLSVYMPTVGIGQIDGDYGNFFQTSTDDVYVPYIDSLDASKVSYYTPRLFGFQAGISYTPEALNQGNSVVFSKATSNYKNIIEGAANYTGEFGLMKLKVSSGIFTADSDTESSLEPKGFTGYQAGAQFGFAGFTLGGGYTNWGGASSPGAGLLLRDAWNFGAAYEIGSFGIAGGYAKIQDEISGNADVWAVGLNYAIAPGLLLQADYVQFQQNLIGSGSTEDG